MAFLEKIDSTGLFLGGAACLSGNALGSTEFQLRLEPQFL